MSDSAPDNFDIDVDDGPLACERARVHRTFDNARKSAVAMQLPDYAVVVLYGLYDQGDERLGDLDFLGRAINSAALIQEDHVGVLRSDYPAFFTVVVGLRVIVAGIALCFWRGRRDFAIDLSDAMNNAGLECHTPQGRETLVRVGKIAIRQLRQYGVLGAAL